MNADLDIGYHFYDRLSACSGADETIGACDQRNFKGDRTTGKCTSKN